MRSWTPPAEHGLLWWDGVGVCCCCGGGDSEERGGGEGGGRAGTEGREAPNSSMYPGSNSLRRETENENIIFLQCFVCYTIIYIVVNAENCFHIIIM